MNKKNRAHTTFCFYWHFWQHSDIAILHPQASIKYFRKESICQSECVSSVAFESKNILKVTLSCGDFHLRCFHFTTAARGSESMLWSLPLRSSSPREQLSSSCYYPLHYCYCIIVNIVALCNGVTWTHAHILLIEDLKKQRRAFPIMQL